MSQTPSIPREVVAFLQQFDRAELKTTYGTMSYIDDGNKRATRTIVFLHGNPTWSYLYRHLLKRLGKQYRVVCPDLVGFGMSAKPTLLQAYGIESHAQAVTTLIRNLKLQNVILVGQDWGGPIAVLTARQLGRKCTGLVLMNTYLPGLQIFSQFGRRFMKATWGRFAILRLDAFRRVAFRLGFHRRVSRHVRQAYMFPHARQKDRLGVWAFPAQIPDPHSRDDATAQTIQTIDSYVTTSKTPKLLLFSDHDPVFRLSMVRPARTQIAHATYKEISNAGHFLQEDQPDIIVQHIRRWLNTIG